MDVNVLYIHGPTDAANGTLRLSPVNGSDNGTRGMLEVAVGGRCVLGVCIICTDTLGLSDIHRTTHLSNTPV